MTPTAWKAFSAARDHYREFITQLRRRLPSLAQAQQKLVDKRDGPSYTVETPIVYNEALDDIGPDDDIKLILTADNPGRREQAAENRRYLVGPSGKITERFFRETPELKSDFRKNVIILNKTPIHTPRTAELGELKKLLLQDSGLSAKTSASVSASASVAAIEESQRTMAELLLEFQQALSTSRTILPVWIIGYSEMKKGGIFETYTETLKTLYAKRPAAEKKIFFYRHFSMNQFTIDLHKQAAAGETVSQTLERIGTAYRLRILGR
ncbi:MAG: hypothetical protein LBN21_11065 [Treponema sp.]|jgi:hypothetical protein|nr:hypothetical protein [Treponema sp.]